MLHTIHNSNNHFTSNISHLTSFRLWHFTMCICIVHQTEFSYSLFTFQFYWKFWFRHPECAFQTSLQIILKTSASRLRFKSFNFTISTCCSHLFSKIALHILSVLLHLSMDYFPSGLNTYSPSVLLSLFLCVFFFYFSIWHSIHFFACVCVCANVCFVHVYFHLYSKQIFIFTDSNLIYLHFRVHANSFCFR